MAARDLPQAMTFSHRQNAADHPRKRAFFVL